MLPCQEGVLEAHILDRLSLDPCRRKGDTVEATRRVTLAGITLGPASPSLRDLDMGTVHL
jgi:hypothetical protein